MADEQDRGASRRTLLKAGLAAALVPGGIGSARSAFAAPDFETSADIAKAEAEGELLFYTHDSDPAGAAIVGAFSKDFPKIKARYLRAQNGALYAKLLAERSAGRFDVDAIQFSEITTAMDFQKRGGFALYQSPQTKAYDAKYLSSPAGSYFYSGINVSAIAYNSDRVSEADAPKTWKDLLDPKWRNAMSCKQSTSGSQFVQWYELKRLYGDSYWKDFAKQRPRGFDSRAQMFDRLAKGDDKICAMAEWAGYELVKDKGAPVKFVTPADGLPTASLAFGILDKAPHPQAARLFLDWMMSPRGQAVYQTNPFFYYQSARKGAPPMPGGFQPSDYKLLLPEDMTAMAATHDAFVKEWDGMLGL